MSLITTGILGSHAGTVNEFKQIALDAIGSAEDALWSMDRSIYIGDGNAGVTKDTYGTQYNKDNNGTEPVFTHSLSLPDWPNYSLALNDIGELTIPEFVEAAPVEPVISRPQAPTEDGSTIDVPGAAPVISDIVIPEVPLLNTIDDPTRFSITLPTAPTIDIGDFDVAVPTLGSVQKPIADFNWDEDIYTSALLTQIVNRVDEMSQGGTGIPDAIWDAIWDKDNERESKAAVKAIQDVNKQWASRGFSLPQGAQSAQILEMQQKLQDSAVSRARDIAIKQSELEIENMKFSVQQGIAMESMRGQFYQQYLNRTLEASKYTYQLAIEVLNADIALYNSQIQAYTAQAQVHKIIIEAELAELEIYKTELEGQKLINDINTQEVQIFKTLIDAETVKIEQYNAILAGVQTEVSVNKLRLEAYAQEVIVDGERLKAVGLIYENYKTAMSGAKIEADIYQTSVSAFGAKVSAYGSQVDAEAKRTNVELEVNKQYLTEYTTKLDAYKAQVSAESEKLKYDVERFEVDVKKYALLASEEKNRVDTLLKDIAESTKFAGLQLQASITDANNYVKANIAEAAMDQKISESIATIESNIASAAMSTINTSSDVSDSAENIQTIGA